MRRLSSILLILAITIQCTPVFSQSARVREAADLILKLCIADSTQVEITQNKGSVQVTGGDDSVTIKKSEVVGLAGGISSSLNQLSAQQASEARACTQRYLKKIVDAIIYDDHGSDSPQPPQTGDIHVTRFPGNPQCAVSYSIYMNGIQIVPFSDDWLVQGIKLGRSRWVIKGQVNCGNGMAFCMSNAENQAGEVDLQNGGRYLFNWGIVPGSMRGSECSFALYKQS